MLGRRSTFLQPPPHATPKIMGANFKLQSIRQFERMGANVGVKCKCGRTFTIDPQVLFDLVDRKGWSPDNLDMIRSKMRCRVCGAKGCCRLGLSYNKPGES